ncbi:MAG: TraR/DksA family transcriptional regulator [Planctomycetaceae bacterium]
MSLAARRQLQSRLANITAVLMRVKEGTYGKSIKCGRDILPKRLEYMPEMPFCTACNS